MTTNPESSVYVTSTPNHSNAGSIISSDVSSLSEIEQSSTCSNTLVGSTASVTKRNKISELVWNLSLSETTASVTETDQTFRKPTKKADTIDRRAFMPTDEQLCFYRVIADEENVEDVAYHWINLNRCDTRESMVFIIQFFVDVASYHTFDVSKWYKENGTNFNEISRYMEMEENCPDVVTNYNYLLATKSNWSFKAHSAIYKFIDKLVKLSDTHNLITETCAFPEMFRFIKLMSFTKVLALKHTGVILALKFAVACTEILQDAENEKKTQEQQFLSTGKKSRHINKLIEKFVEKIDILKKSLKFLYNAVLKNCCVHDPRLEDMRKVCAENMCNLMIVNPNIFLNEMAISVLLEYLIDMRKNVRLSALQTFKKLVRIDNLSKYLQVSIMKILRTIGRTIFDIDYHVAVVAVDVITCSLRIYRNDVTKLIIDNLCKMVYNKHYPLAAAAGNFLITYIRHQQDDNTVTVIRNIVKFSYMPRMGQHIPLLVESLVDCAQELQEFETIIKMLFRDAILSSNDQIILLEILSNTVVQVITGKAKFLRNNYRKGEIDLNKNRAIMCIFIPALASLIEHAYDERSLKNLLEIALVFDYNDPILLKYKEDAFNIFELLSKRFLNSDCKDLLAMIVKVLVLNIDTLCPLRNQASYQLQTIAEHTINKFENYLEHVSPDWSEQHVTSFETNLMKISIIYEHYNMSFEWSFGLFSCLPPNIKKSNEKILAYDLVCGRHYLAWQLKNLLEADNEPNIMEETMEQFIRKLDEYLNICFKYLKKAKSHLFETQAFECICDLHAKIESEIEGPIRINSKLETLKLSVKQEAEINCMINFLNKNVFQLSVPDSYGQKMLAKFLQAVLNRMLPLHVLTKVLRYYYKFNIKYTNLLDQTLQQLRIIDTTVLAIVILSTLQAEFNNLSDVNNVESSESMDLKKLTVQFSLFLAYEDVTRIVEMGITFALKDEGKLPFLSFIELFCTRLRAKEKNNILNYLNEGSKEKFADNKYVRNFVFRLKAKKTPRKYVKLPVGDKSETSEPVSSEIGIPTDSVVHEDEDNTIIEEYSE